MPTNLAFSDAVTVHEFDDGWKVLDLRSGPDMDLFGQAMNNCWTSTYWLNKVLPAPGAEDAEALAAQVEELARKRWDRPEYRKAYGDAWVEVRIDNDVKNSTGAERAYKLIAFVDDEGNLRAGASLGLKDKPGITYGSCDHLHQKRKSWVKLDGFDFCLLELHRYREAGDYGYVVTGDTLDHVAGWWQAVCEGEWQNEQFEKCRVAVETKKVGAYA